MKGEKKELFFLKIRKISIKEEIFQTKEIRAETYFALNKHMYVCLMCVHALYMQVFM
jgi:hypothetical protein